MMYSDKFVKFISENWNIFEKRHLSEPVLLFFLLNNLYDSVFLDLKEFSILEDSLFDSVVDSYEHSECSNHQNGLSKPQKLFSKTNFLLTESQKTILKILLDLQHSKEEGSFFNSLRLYHYKDAEGNNFMLVPESSLEEIVKTFTSILFNQKSKPHLNRKMAVNKCREYLNLAKAKHSSEEISSLLNGESFSCSSSRALTFSLSFFLLFVNPSFAGVASTLAKSLNGKSGEAILNCTLIVNNLIRLHPKESGLWEVKSVLTELWFSRFQPRFKRFSLLSEGGFRVRNAPNNLLYSHLMRTICKLFTDKLLSLDQFFVPEVLSLKPFNNCVTNYLAHQYKCVAKYVLSPFLETVKSARNLRHFRKFREFTFLSNLARYKVAMANAVFKFFFSFYRRLLGNFGSPGIFALLVNLLKGKSWNSLSSSVLSLRDPNSSCFLYTRMDQDFEDALSMCDKSIKNDSQNCWILNKSNLLLSLLDRRRWLFPLNSLNSLGSEIFNFRLLYVLNWHASTWASFVDLRTVYLFGQGQFRQKGVFRLSFSPGSGTGKGRKRAVVGNLDEFKSESVRIRKFLSEFSAEKKAAYLEGYGFPWVRFVHEESCKVLEKFHDCQIDHIFNSFNQLLQVLLHLFSSVYTFKKTRKWELDLTLFKPLFQAIDLVSQYSRVVPKMGTRVNVLVGINLAKKMHGLARHLFYKYHEMLNRDGHWDQCLDTLVARLSLLFLSFSFRFYLHWSVSSQSRVEMLQALVLKLK